MTRNFRYAAFIAGLIAILWVGTAYVGTNWSALLITALIGAFYVIGGWELQRFDRATDTLSLAMSAMTGPPAALADWLERIHPSLQNAVRLRVEGERVGLPGPALTPYLAGLLVLLGMMGTFLGMVVTLNGTGTALESASDLEAMRASLAAPVKGLGLAFGTALAGVAASAMLGLVSALCRRDRLQASQALDGRIATTLRPFTHSHRREESFKLQEKQSQAMPQLVDRLQLMLEAIERQSAALNERLVSNQEVFHGRAESAYAKLTSDVGDSLKESLAECARLAGATIQPAVEAAMAAVAREGSSVHEHVRRSCQGQIEALSGQLELTSARVAEVWKSALADHQRTSKSLSDELHTTLVKAAAEADQRSAAQLLASEKSQAALRTENEAFDQQRMTTWTHALQSMASSLSDAWKVASSHAASQQQAVCKTIADTASEISAQTENHARNTIAEIARLVAAASDAPRVASEVIAELRQSVSDSLARDNATLEERGRLLQSFGNVLEAVNQTSNEQRLVVEKLAASSADVLDRVGTRLAEKLDYETGKLRSVTVQVAGSAIEVASLGEAFSHAVQLFSESNDKLGAQLQRIEAALGKSASRSDEQLAYYVAQAREVIDLSMLSQRQIVEELQQMAGRAMPAMSEA